MFDKLSYRHKNYLLLALALVVGYLAYSRAIRATLNLKAECALMEEQSALAENSDAELLSTQQELDKIRALVGSNSENIYAVNRDLLSFVSLYCQKNRVVLKDFPEMHQAPESGYRIITHTVETEGGFIALLQLLYQLETDFKQVKVIAARFYTKENMRTKTNHLYGLFYVQNILKN